ncbi:NUDIX domain-containing protein [Demequina aurantiaca]|uniref:NUDIX domain-containing protein n=1 Tax=Demequina aurantiaca TaxID=676200 RepID=UPI00078602A4|nr:NUDIX hydrolase [Demequina aurantiaca]
MASDGFRLADVRAPRPVTSTSTVFEGRVWNVDSDDIDLGEAGHVTRDYVAHPGAVAIFALNERDEVYLVHQYRHPVRSELWEPPAGLLDVEGETLQAAAARELYEEADLTAATWHTLADFYTSPGGSAEAIRIFLARDLTDVPEAERHVREDEEADMVGRWVALDDVLAAIGRGDVACPPLLVGSFALDAARRADWATLRPADASWLRD